MQLDEASEYQLVSLENGLMSVHSLAYGQTFHPVVGPAAEAKILYVDQLHLESRLRASESGLVVWDIGLGAAANATAVLDALAGVSGRITMVSFDRSIAPLQFALNHSLELGYLKQFVPVLGELAMTGRTLFQNQQSQVDWRLVTADFSRWIHEAGARVLPPPDAILFDPFSPAVNPEMWTCGLFARLFSLLDPGRPCALATYSRSTMLRASLLLAGFFVGRGRATGEKEETTIAANSLSLLESPLDEAWLKRARNSTSAEPLWEPQYRQAPLAAATWARLVAHPQFANDPQSGRAPCPFEAVS